MTNLNNLEIKKTKSKKKLYCLALGKKPERIITISKMKGKKSIYHYDDFAEYEENGLKIWTPYYSLNVDGIKDDRILPSIDKEVWKGEVRWRISLIEKGKAVCNKEIELDLRDELNNQVN